MKPTDFRQMLLSYQAWAHSICAPVFWEDGKGGSHNGSMTFLRTEQGVLGITNAHVADALADCTEEIGHRCQIGGAYLDPGRLIAKHPSMDLATFRLSDIILSQTAIMTDGSVVVQFGIRISLYLSGLSQRVTNPSRQRFMLAGVCGLIAYNVPVSTLRAWVQARAARGERPSNLERERRGSLAAKLESKIHDVVESITPEVIQKATLSQRGVFVGIGVDKLKVLLGHGIDPDPTAELCRLLNVNRAQLPERLELAPGEEVPEEFAYLLEAKPNAKGEYEVENPSQSADADITETHAQSHIDDSGQ